VREPEPDVVRRAQAGDLGAFEELVRNCQADAWRFAYHLTRDRTLADDVTQESFVRAYRGLHTFSGASKFTSWLLRIVHNCASDARRRAVRERTTVERVAESMSRHPSSNGGVEERLRLQAAVEALPPRFREPFVLIEVLGYDYRETSAILQVPVGTLKSRMHRARAALMRRLSDEEETAGEM
jgi:RNA polymerase sigma-70 factor (ECF subfamily)